MQGFCCCACGFHTHSVYVSARLTFIKKHGTACIVKDTIEAIRNSTFINTDGLQPMAGMVLLMFASPHSPADARQNQGYLSYG